MKNSKRTIVYITQHEDFGSPAAFINSKRRILAMEKAGYRVFAISYRPASVLRDIGLILKRLRQASILVIRIDGSELLDKFTLLRFLKWDLKIMWEIHAFPDENYNMNYPLPSRLNRIMRYMKRKLLSYLVHTTIFISEELKHYARSKIVLRNSVIIPNFVLPGEYDLKSEAKSPVIKALKTSGVFIVLWGGLAGLRWQALDLIEDVARRMFSVDPTILFIMIGSDKWRTTTWHKNILALESLPRSDFLNFVRISNVCLALYHTPAFTPFYFSPLKILDYMMMEKPVIATRKPPITRIIRENNNGYLTPNDPKDIMKKILTLKKDRGLSRSMGLRAKKYVKANFALQGAVKQYKRVFSQ